MAKTSKKKRAASRISEAVEKQIVELSLQYHEYGARRLLPLLAQVEISVSASAVYNILRRHGLQNRSLRRMKLEARGTAEPPPAPAIALPQPVEKLEQVTADIVETAPLSRALPLPKGAAKAILGGSWYLTLVNILLLVLLVYLGLHTVQNVRNVLLEPEAIAVIGPEQRMAAMKPQAASGPLGDYRIIWKRNLFNLSKEEIPAPKREIPIEEIELATKDLGLKLVGTVVADDPFLSRAFFDNRRTQKQEAYRVGERAGEVLIKKVLRNKVIVATKEGDKLLIAEIGETGPSLKSPRPKQRRVGNSSAPLQKPESRKAIAGDGSINLEHKAVSTSLGNPQQFMQEIGITPYLQGDQPAGFRIGSVPTQNILRKMGLRSRDVITAINGQEITGPEQANAFLRTLEKGGDITIKIKRRRRTRQIRLTVG